MIAWVLLGLAAFLKHQADAPTDVASWGSAMPPMETLPRTSADVLPGDDAGRDPQDPYTGYTSWGRSTIPTSGFARQDTEALLNPNVTNRIVSMPSEPRANVSGLRGRRL